MRTHSQRACPCVKKRIKRLFSKLIGKISDAWNVLWMSMVLLHLAYLKITKIGFRRKISYFKYYHGFNPIYFQSFTRWASLVLGKSTLSTSNLPLSATPYTYKGRAQCNLLHYCGSCKTKTIQRTVHIYLIYIGRVEVSTLAKLNCTPKPPS